MLRPQTDTYTCECGTNRNFEHPKQNRNFCVVEIEPKTLSKSRISNTMNIYIYMVSPPAHITPCWSSTQFSHISPHGDRRSEIGDRDKDSTVRGSEIGDRIKASIVRESEIGDRTPDQSLCWAGTEIGDRTLDQSLYKAGESDRAPDRSLCRAGIGDRRSVTGSESLQSRDR